MDGELNTSNHSRDAASLQAAFRQEGCPVCRVVLENMHMAMDTWNYEGFTDVAYRQLLAHVRGFCPVHTWQLAERNNTFQLAVVYKEILEDMLDTMRTPHASEERHQHGVERRNCALATLESDNEKGERPCNETAFDEMRTGLLRTRRGLMS